MLASVGNRYNLKQLQQAAIVLDRSMRKPWEKPGRYDIAHGRRHQTVHHTEDMEDISGDDTETEAPREDSLDQDNEDLYLAYMTAKARYRDNNKARGIDSDAVRRSAEERIRLAKSKSFCAACGQRGHWHRDAVCPKRKTDNTAPPTTTNATKPHSVHVANIFELSPSGDGSLMAITDTACSKSVVGTPWLQKYIDLGDGPRGHDVQFVYEKEAFRFGASRVYESNYSAILFLLLEGRWIGVKAAVIHGDVPLLLSRGALARLGMVLDVARNMASFEAVDLKGFKLCTTSTGHPAIPVDHQGRKPPAGEAVPKGWPEDGLVIFGAREVYMTVHGVADERVPPKVGAGGHSRREEPSPKIFFDKKLDEAVKIMLLEDTLHVETFLSWWSGSKVTSDFWLEAPNKLVRVHVTPRKSFFDPAKWQTSLTFQRDALLHALGDVRETWGVAVNTQRALTTVSDLWRKCASGAYPTLWIGRSVFIRASASRPLRLTRHEPPCHAIMEDDKGRDARNLLPKGDPGEPQMDSGRATACDPDGMERGRRRADREQHSQRSFQHEPRAAPHGSNPPEHRPRAQGLQGLDHAEDQGSRRTERDTHGGGEVSRQSLPRRAQGVCRVGGSGGEGQRSEHASESQEVRQLVPGSETRGQVRSDVHGGKRLPGPGSKRDHPAATAGQRRSFVNGIFLGDGQLYDGVADETQEFNTSAQTKGRTKTNRHRGEASYNGTRAGRGCQAGDRTTGDPAGRTEADSQKQLAAMRKVFEEVTAEFNTDDGDHREDNSKNGVADRHGDFEDNTNTRGRSYANYSNDNSGNVMAKLNTDDGVHLEDDPDSRAIDDYSDFEDNSENVVIECDTNGSIHDDAYESCESDGGNQSRNKNDVLEVLDAHAVCLCRGQRKERPDARSVGEVMVQEATKREDYTFRTLERILEAHTGLVEPGVEWIFGLPCGLYEP